MQIKQGGRIVGLSYEILSFLEREARVGDFVIVGPSPTGWFGQVQDMDAD